jgi:hypothetical protein
MSTLRRSELWAALVLACSLTASTARADDDSLAPYRDRFRQGMEKYRAGAMAEAIRAWSAIYEEIGPQRGYRLSYNLARAYEANFETSRAAERYQSFLDEVARRKADEALDPQALDPLVEREAAEAQSRLDDLNTNSGRIRVDSGARTVLTQIDGADPRLGSFVSYVAPGDHVVVFAPGATDQERHDISVKAGELIVVSPAPPPAVPPPSISPVVKARRFEMVHPFPPAVLYVSVGVTVASVAAPILTYANAWSLDTRYNSTGSIAQKNIDSPEYYAARTTAYATLAIPLGLAAVSGTLIVYYLGRTKERELTVGASLLPGAGAACVRGTF